MGDLGNREGLLNGSKRRCMGESTKWDRGEQEGEVAPKVTWGKLGVAPC